MSNLRLIVTALIFICTIQANAAGFDKKVFDSVIETVRENARYEVTQEDIYRGAVQGVMQMLEEKNNLASDREKGRKEMIWNNRNVLLNPVQTENLEINTSGRFAGVGIAIQYEPEEGRPNPVIVNVLEGGGKKAGLMKEDQILKINNREIGEYKTLDNIVGEIRGPAGSKVRLKILRGSEVMDFDVTREVIRLAVVESRILPAGTDMVGYIKLLNFSETAAQDFKKELDILNSRNVKKIILDLRNNTGGLFNTSTDIMGFFEKKSEVLFQEQKKTGTGLKPFRTTSDGIASDLYVAVLVNGNTRSVAEAMTSMFKNRENSVVIGTPTFGKASIEEMFILNDGYRLLLTVGMLYDREGNTWHGKGIRPDIIVPETEDETDNVMDLAMDYIQRI